MSDELRKAVRRAISRAKPRADADSEKSPPIKEPPPLKETVIEEKVLEEIPEQSDSQEQEIISDIKPTEPIESCTDRSVIMILARR